MPRNLSLPHFFRHWCVGSSQTKEHCVFAQVGLQSPSFLLPVYSQHLYHFRYLLPTVPITCHPLWSSAVEPVPPSGRTIIHFTLLYSVSKLSWQSVITIQKSMSGRHPRQSFLLFDYQDALFFSTVNLSFQKEVFDPSPLLDGRAMKTTSFFVKRLDRQN